MARTALDLISSALRLINVQSSGEPTEISAANDSLVVLNDMIDSWNTDRLSIFTTSSNDFPLVALQQSYTLGAGGNFNIPRPAQIDAMSAILLYNAAVPIEEPIEMYSVQQWQENIPVKNVTGSFPQVCYDTGDFPLRVLNFWPIPIDGTNSVRIYSWAALTQPAALATPLAYPPGYAEAIRYNLSLRLAAEFASPVPPVVAQIAVESLGRLKTMNAPDLELKSDLMPNPAGYNWKADLFGIPY